MLAAADEIDITITGVGGHAAMPHLCVDPSVCAAAVIQALQNVVSRSVDPLDSAVISITKMSAGDAFNVIPDTVSLGGTVRSLHPQTQDLLESRIGETVAGIASAHGCTAETNYIRGYPVTMNHPDAVERYERIARDCLARMWSCLWPTLSWEAKTFPSMASGCQPVSSFSACSRKVKPTCQGFTMLISTSMTRPFRPASSFSAIWLSTSESKKHLLEDQESLFSATFENSLVAAVSDGILISTIVDL